ncbi:hypothetical protein PsorP6_006984 [Peronosclerospora sorghi]|uniref:Uncharacterized protein n=1 Tax=Peronosclerospora sorghi TaxID=230839 RepID=A0ACC0W8H6_9STRA|nr:hypothetical protein PsorP6_006984 [Peronosclerospora sorghi]
MLKLDILVCSISGKPVLHHVLSSSSLVAPDDASSSTLASSLQGLLSFVSCTHDEELQELHAAHFRGVFRTTATLTFAAIERPARACTFGLECLQHLLHLLEQQILVVLSAQGLDVLRRQPGYDLRDLLHGTDKVTHAVVTKWATTPTLRLRDGGVPFLRLKLETRRQVTRALEVETSSMICALLVAREQVVAMHLPKKKHFSLLVDDLLLVLNFIYHTPSLATSETWTPICFANFNARGFLYAYVVFLSPHISLLLLSSDASPDHFPSFQATKTRIVQALADMNAMRAIQKALTQQLQWQPHKHLPLVRHFIYKNELTGECTHPSLPDHLDTCVQVLNQYAKLYYIMFPTASKPQVLGQRFEAPTAARFLYDRSATGLFVATSSPEYRLVVCFHSFAPLSDAQDQLDALLKHLRHDDALMSLALFLPSSSIHALGMWP